MYIHIYIYIYIYSWLPGALAPATLHFNPPARPIANLSGRPVAYLLCYRAARLPGCLAASFQAGKHTAVTYTNVIRN